MAVRVGPGEYIADVTEGIMRVEDLPAPRIVLRSRNCRRCACPQCGRMAGRRKTVLRILHDLGDPSSGRPLDMHVKYSQHQCARCYIYFNAPMDVLAAPKSHYSH